MRHLLNLMESEIEQTAYISIQQSIYKLEKILKNFNEISAAKGYTVAVEYAKQGLHDTTLSDWYIDLIANNDYKLQKMYSKLKDTRKQLILKIDSGI